MGALGPRTVGSTMTGPKRLLGKLRAVLALAGEGLLETFFEGEATSPFEKGGIWRVRTTEIYHSDALMDAQWELHRDLDVGGQLPLRVLASSLPEMTEKEGMDEKGMSQRPKDEEPHPSAPTGPLLAGKNMYSIFRRWRTLTKHPSMLQRCGVPNADTSSTVCLDLRQVLLLRFHQVFLADFSLDDVARVRTDVLRLSFCRPSVNFRRRRADARGWARFRAQKPLVVANPQPTAADRNGHIASCALSPSPASSSLKLPAAERGVCDA
ncbi:hypothetical protein K438DRAFT_371866 [Mycena galopus ATCC 62051]|nr:hypothetical protein K438DRAFT_371866 [Mycena galopus ATCC 62051]